MSDTTQVLCPDGKHRTFHKGHIGTVVDPTTQECVEHYQGFVYSQNKRVYGIVVVGSSCFTPHGKNAELVSGTFALPEAIHTNEVDEAFDNPHHGHAAEELAELEAADAVVQSSSEVLAENEEFALAHSVN